MDDVGEDDVHRHARREHQRAERDEHRLRADRAEAARAALVVARGAGDARRADEVDERAVGDEAEEEHHRRAEPQARVVERERQREHARADRRRK